MPGQQASVYSAPSTTTCCSRIQSLTHSCFQQQLAAWLTSQRVNVASWYSAPSTTIYCARIHSLTDSLVSTAGHGAWSNLWDENCLALSAIVKHWIHSCFQTQLAAWLRSQRANVASWYSAPSTTTCCARIQSLTHSLVSTAGNGAWSNL